MTTETLIRSSDMLTQWAVTDWVTWFAAAATFLAAVTPCILKIMRMCKEIKTHETVAAGLVDEMAKSMVAKAQSATTIEDIMIKRPEINAPEMKVIDKAIQTAVAAGGTNPGLERQS